MVQNKKELVLFLQNIVKVLGNELSEVKKEIEILDAKIESFVQKMKLINQHNVIIQDGRKSLELLLSDLNSSAEKEKSIVENLSHEIENLKNIIEETNEKLKIRKAQISSLERIPGGVYLWAAYGKDSVNLEKRLITYKKQREQMIQNLNISKKKAYEYGEIIFNISGEKKKLDKSQYLNERKIKELGIKKTEQEHLKSSIEHFKSRAQSLLDTVNLNIEFSDDMINTKDDIIAQIKETYDEYNRPFPKELLLPQSSSLSSIYSLSSL